MTKDMTKGKLAPLIISFTIPLVLGNILQLTYNAVDSIIVGRFVSSLALAAIGTSNPLMTLVILMLNGICLGAGILVGLLYGAKDYRRLERQVSTALIAGTIFSLVMSLFAFLFAKELLMILQVENQLLIEATSYLRIVSLGLVFTFLYNFFASTLRAMGDSKSPLIFLGVSAILNIIGDLFFVIVLDFGIHGVALSTVISEGLSALMCLVYIKKNVPVLNLGKRWFIFDHTMLSKTISYGIVTALQQSTVQIGKLGIQMIVNTMGVSTTAAFNAVNRTDDFAIVPEQNIAHAMTAVMAQNKGAKEEQRVREAFRVGNRIELIYSLIVGLLFFILANPIMQLFTKDMKVIKLGEVYLHCIAFMYILPAITNAIQGYFRGIGDLKITFFSSLINMTGRVISALIFVFTLHIGMIGIPLSYLVGWICMLLFEVPFLFHMLNKHDR